MSLKSSAGRRVDRRGARARLLPRPDPSIYQFPYNNGMSSIFAFAAQFSGRTFHVSFG
jgi:hypothetical protein